MGLKGIDTNSGVSFKVRKNNKPPRLRDKEDDGVERPTKNKVVEKPTTSSVKNFNSRYDALIDGEILEYDLASETDENPTPIKAVCLGKGLAVLVNLDTGDNTITEQELYFWKKVTDVNDEDGKDEEESTDDVENIPGLDGVEINSIPDGMDLNRNPEESKSNILLTMVAVCKDDKGDQQDQTNEVNQIEELTMNKKPEFKKANELLASVKESGDAGVDILIDYCKVSFAEVFTKTNNGEDATAVTSDLQNQMVYIISEVNKNDLLTPEAKEKLTEAIESESIEYQKLLETLTDVTTETRTLLEKKEDDDMSWGTVALFVIGVVVAVSAAYTAYRYFEPEDVVLDMSTMSFMDR